MAWTLVFEPGPHWWEVSALASGLPLLPKYYLALTNIIIALQCNGLLDVFTPNPSLDYFQDL